MTRQLKDVKYRRSFTSQQDHSFRFPHTYGDTKIYLVNFYREDNKFKLS